MKPLFIEVKSNIGKAYYVNLSEILYIEKNQENAIVHLTNGENIITDSSYVNLKSEIS